MRVSLLELVDIGEVTRLGTFGRRLHHAVGASRISFTEARLFELPAPLAWFLDPILPGRGVSLLVAARVV